MKRKDIRKAAYLLNTTYYKSKKDVEKLKSYLNTNNSPLIGFNVAHFDLIHAYYDFFNFTEEERHQHWLKHQNEFQKYSKSYNDKPIIPRKDNSRIYDDSQIGGRYPRLPKKARSKKVWANFYKKFPRMHPNYDHNLKKIIC